MPTMYDMVHNVQFSQGKDSIMFNVKVFSYDIMCCKYKSVIEGKLHKAVMCNYCKAAARLIIICTPSPHLVSIEGVGLDKISQRL